MISKQYVLPSCPSGFSVLNNFSEKNIELPSVLNDQILLQVLFYSIDPYMRGRMNDTKSYAPPFQINEPISVGVLAKVLQSASTLYLPGDIVFGMLPW